jgi:hypothetical protein
VNVNLARSAAGLEHAPIDLSTPAGVMSCLADVGRELAERQNEFEQTARDWTAAKREIELERAKGLITATGDTVTERKAFAEKQLDPDLFAHEVEYEAHKTVLRVLELLVSVCQSLLKAQGNITF